MAWPGLAGKGDVWESDAEGGGRRSVCTSCSREWEPGEKGGPHMRPPRGPNLSSHPCTSPSAALLLSLQVIEAGANALVAGSAVFKAPSYKDAIAGIKASKRAMATAK